MNRKTPRLILWILVLLALAAYFIPLSFRPLFKPDETRYFEIAREMNATGQYLVPHLAGAPYFEKPVLGHWFNAAAQLLFGEHLFAARAAGALCAVLTGLILFLGLRKLGQKQAAFPAALIFLSTPYVHGIGTFQVLDMPFTFFMTAIWMAFLIAWQERENRRFTASFLWLIVCGTACAGAFMIKGFLAFALPAITLAPFLILRKQYKELLTMSWPVLLTAAVLILPLAWLIHRADPQFWDYFIREEHINRFLEGATASDVRAQPPYYYLPVLLGGALPWLLFLPDMLCGLQISKSTRWKLLPGQNPLLVYALLCTGVPLLFFSVSSGKLATYILPLFPWLAMIAGMGLSRAAEHDFSPVFRRTAVIAGWVFLAAGALFSVYLLICRCTGWIPEAGVLYAPGEHWYLALAGVLLAGNAFLQAGKPATSVPDLRISMIAAGMLTAAALAQFAMPGFLLRQSAPVEFLRQIRNMAGPDTVIMTDSDLAASTALAFGHTDIQVFGKPGELNYGLVRRENGKRFRDMQSAINYFDTPPHPEVLLITLRPHRLEYVQDYAVEHRKWGKFHALRFPEIPVKKP